MLWASGSDGLAEPLDPQILAAAHPMWRAEVDRCGPWERDGQWWRGTSACGQRPAAPVIICGPCSSGLDVAHHLAAQGDLPYWATVIAVSQNAGRGQLRRPWMSPPGNLYASWRWPALPAAWSSLFPLVCGWITAEALAQWGIEVNIKWPNDLLDIHGRKVGGILVEERGDVTLAGVGVNINEAPPDNEIREQWSPKAACLSPLSDSFSSILLWQGLVNQARNWYESLARTESPRAFLDDLARRLAWSGRRVRVRGAGGEYLAIPVGLTDDGGLVLNREGREEVLYSGSISLK